MITLIVKTRTTRTKRPMRRRMIAITIMSRKRVTRPCTTTSPLHQAWTLCQKKGVALVQDLLLALVPVLALAQAAVAGATPIIMCLMMTASQAYLSSMITCTLSTTMTDKSIVLMKAILFLPPSALQKQRRVSIASNRELRQQSKIRVSHLVSLFQIGD